MAGRANRYRCGCRICNAGPATGAEPPEGARDWATPSQTRMFGCPTYQVAGASPPIHPIPPTPKLLDLPEVRLTAPRPMIQGGRHSSEEQALPQAGDLADGIGHIVRRAVVQAKDRDHPQLELFKSAKTRHMFGLAWSQPMINKGRNSTSLWGAGSGMNCQKPSAPMFLSDQSTAAPKS